MRKYKISIIVAMDERRGIGIGNKLPWDIPEDRERFRELTRGHPVIMGRKTFESILGYRGKPLPDRTNIIITRDPSYQALGCVVCHSLDEALKKARTDNKEEVFVIGGGQIYEQALSLVDKLYLTIVEGSYPADTFFPDYSQFKKVVSEQKGESGGYKYTFLELERL